MSNYQYKARAPENWDKRAKGSIYDGFAKDEFETFSLAKDNFIRILPPTWENAQHYGLDLWVHYSVGPNKGTVICLYKSGRGPCPICEAHARAEAAGREDAKELKPTRRVLVWLLNRKAGEEKKPLLWAMPWTVDRDISKICRDRESGELYMIDHPEQGFDISFDKEGESFQTKYTGFQISRRPSSVDKKHIDYVCQHPLPDTLLWRDYDEVQALFEGEALVKPNSEGQSQPETQSGPEPIHTGPIAVPASVPVPVAAPPRAFVSEWTGTNCSACGRPQYTISPTTATCELGHVVNFSPAPVVATPPPPMMAAPAVAPAPTVEPVATKHVSEPGNAQATPPPSASSSRAAAMRERFQTGKKA